MYIVSHLWPLRFFISRRFQTYIALTPRRSRLLKPRRALMRRAEVDGLQRDDFEETRPLYVPSQ